MIWDDPIKDICDGKNLYVVAPPQILFVLVTNGNQSIIIIFSLFPELEESIRFVLPFTFYSCLDVLFFSLHNCRQSEIFHAILSHLRPHQPSLLCNFPALMYGFLL